MIFFLKKTKFEEIVVKRSCVGNFGLDPREGLFNKKKFT